MDESAARARLKHHVEQLPELASQDLSEADTRADLIDPILRLLGYTSPGDIRREVQVPATKEFLDYELRSNGKTLAIVEAKAVRHSVTDQHAAQCVQYASILGVRWCLITNGLRWALYDAHVNGALETKQVVEISLIEDSVDECWRVLSAIARDNLATPSGLAPLLVDRVVRDQLGRGDSSAVAALRNAVSKTYGMKVAPEVIVASIQHLLTGTSRAEKASSADHGGQDASPPKQAKRGALPGVKVKRQDLIDAGLLDKDALLEATYKGTAYSARLRDGKIVFDGKQYPTLSAAAVSVVGHAMNGWQFWSYKGTRLAALRDRLK